MDFLRVLLGRGGPEAPAYLPGAAAGAGTPSSRQSSLWGVRGARGAPPAPPPAGGGCGPCPVWAAGPGCALAAGGAASEAALRLRGRMAEPPAPRTRAAAGSGRGHRASPPCRESRPCGTRQRHGLMDHLQARGVSSCRSAPAACARMSARVCARRPSRCPCCGCWAKFSGLLSGPGRPAARRVRQVGQMGFSSLRKSPGVGWRVKRCRAVQRKVTAEKESG